VRISESGTRTVIDGPFSETKELVGGFWIWQVKSREEAIEWAKRIPHPSPGTPEVEVEIRQVAGAEDFAESDPTGEIMKKEEDLRKRLEAKQQS
jgi:hypothetical protein